MWFSLGNYFNSNAWIYSPHRFLKTTTKTSYPTRRNTKCLLVYEVNPMKYFYHLWQSRPRKYYFSLFCLQEQVHRHVYKVAFVCDKHDCTWPWRWELCSLFSWFATKRLQPYCWIICKIPSQFGNSTDFDESGVVWCAGWSPLYKGILHGKGKCVHGLKTTPSYSIPIVPLPPIFYVQLDNCWKDNKYKFVKAF